VEHGAQKINGARVYIRNGTDTRYAMKKLGPPVQYALVSSLDSAHMMRAYVEVASNVSSIESLTIWNVLCHRLGWGDYWTHQLETMTIETDGVECMPCPPNSGSPVDSTACQCNPGWMETSLGPSCSQCDAGKFKPLMDSSACQLCPSYSISGVGSTACTCKDGYGAGENGVCEQCASGKYKPLMSGSACQLCPSHSTSGVGSAACTCDVGYSSRIMYEGMLSRVYCTAGSSGTYRESGIVVNGAPVYTYDGTFSRYLWRTMIDNEWAYVINRDYNNNADYLLKWKTHSIGNMVIMDEFCEIFKEWSYGTAKFIPKQVGHVCSQCATDTYKSWVGNDSCVNCPVGLSSPVGSTRQADCSCKPGYTSVDGLNCILCPPGTYKIMPGFHPCTPCPGQYSAVALTTAWDAAQPAHSSGCINFESML